MPVPIAELLVTVAADTTAAVSSLNTLESRLRTTAQTMRDAAPAAAVLAGAGAVIGAGFVGAVKVAATFEKQMSGVRAVMAPDEARELGGAIDDLAISLGAATSFTATQVAGGFEELLKLGVSAEEILGGAGKAVLNLAAATGSDLTASSTVAAQALNAFGLGVEKLPEVVDLLAGVINVTAADLNDIKLGFSDTAATAHSLGFSLLDTAVSLGVLRENALTGNKAGTALRTMLLGLTPATKQQKALFDQLGFTVNGVSNAFFDSTGTIKDATSIAGTLKKAFGGMTPEIRNMTAELLFGRDGMEAVNIFIKEGAEGLAKYTAEVKKISAADQAAERLNNLLGRLEQLGGALESAAIIIGKFFTPAVGAVADVVKEVIQAFTQMTPAAKATATAIVAIAGIVASAAGGLTLLAITARFLAPSFVAVGKVLLTMVPLFRLVATVAAILAAAWATNLGDIQGRVQTAFAAIPSILDRVGNAFAVAGAFWQTTIFPVVQRISTFVSKTFGRLFSFLTSGPLRNFGLVFEKVFAGDIAGAAETFIAILGALVPGLGSIIQNIRTTVESLVTFLSPILANFGLVFGKLFGGDISGALQTFQAIIGALSPPLGKFAEVLATIGGAIGAGVGDFFQNTLPKVADALGGFAAGAGEGFRAFFTETLPPVLDAIGGVAGDIGQGLLAFFNTVVVPVADVALRFAGDIGAGLKTFFTETLPPILEQVGLFAGDVGAALLAFFSEKLPIVAEAAGRFAGDIGAGLTTFFTVTLPAVAESILALGGEVGANIQTFFNTHLPGVTTALAAFQNDPGGAFLVFFRDQLPAVITSMKAWTADTTVAMVDFFQNKTPTIIAGMERFTPQSVQNFLGFFKSFDEVKAQVESLQPLFASLSNFFTAFSNFQLALASLQQRATGALFGNIGFAIEEFAAKVAPTTGPIAQVGVVLETLGTQLAGVTAFFDGAATALNNLATALNSFPIEKFLKVAPGAEGTPTLGGEAGDGWNDFWQKAPGGSKFNSSFGGQGGGGPGGPLVWINQVIVSTEAEMNALAAKIGEAVDRVNAPPDNSGNPALSTGML